MTEEVNPYEQFVKPQAAPPEDKSYNPYDKFVKAHNAPAREFTAGEYGADIAKSGGIGVAKGAIGLVGMPGDARTLASAGVSKLGEMAGIDPDTIQSAKDKVSSFAKFVPIASAFATGPTSHDIQSGIEKHTGEFYKPQTMGGEYAQTIGEFIPGVAAGGVGGGARQVVGNAARYGVAPAVVSETAGQLTKGSDAEPYVRAGTALVTGGLAAAMHRPGSAEAALAGQLPDYVTGAHVTEAGHLMQDAAQRGVRLSWDEALSQVTGRPVLQDIRRVVESAPQTRQRMQNFTADRPANVQNATRNELDQIAPQRPDPSQIGPQAGAAAEGTVNEVRGAINAHSAPDYAAAEAVRLRPAEMARVRALPGFEEASHAVRNDPQLNRYVAHLPDDSVGFLNEVKKQLDQAAQNASAPVAQNRNMQRAAGLGQDAEAVRDAGTRASPDYAHALIGQQTNRERYLEPLLRGPIGKIADKDTTTKQAIDALFPKNPLPGSEDEIGIAVRGVARNNPQAASQLVRAHAEMVFNEASRSLGAEGHQFSGARFALQIAGNPQQRANLREAVQALPNGDARWNGFNRLLDVMEATGQRQPIGSKTSFNTQELSQLSQSGGVVGAAQTIAAPESWLNLFKGKMEQWKLGRNLNGLADILTNPQSGPLLQRLADAPANSRAAIARRLITQFGSASGPLRITVHPLPAEQRANANQ